MRGKIVVLLDAVGKKWVQKYFLVVMILSRYENSEILGYEFIQISGTLICSYHCP